MKPIDYISENYPDALKMNDFDDCVLGVCDRFGQEPIIAYDLDKVLAKLRRMGMTHEEAVEFYQFNQLGAWMGDQTPCFVTILDGRVDKGTQHLSDDVIASFMQRKDVFRRADGRTEWVCEHGVGHTITVPKAHLKDESWWEHGCDGCCRDKDVVRLQKSLLRQKPRQSVVIHKKGRTKHA